MRYRTAAAAALIAVAAGAGCGGDEDARTSSPAAEVKPVGKEVAGSVVQFADCGDWVRGTREERVVTIVRLRGQLTPQRSKTAESPLSDERAYELMDKTCGSRVADSLRLYKLYVRMQGWAPLSE